MSADIIPFRGQSAPAQTHERSLVARLDRLAELARQGAFGRPSVALSRRTLSVLQEVCGLCPRDEERSDMTLQMCRMLADLRDMHEKAPPEPPRRKASLSLIDGGVS